MVDFNEVLKKRIVYEIPGMDQARVVENRVYKTVNGVDLLLVNRVLDYGFEYEEGVALIARLRQSHPNIRTMLVSNYAEAQQAAVAAGALPGFGKREIGTPRVKELLTSALALEATTKL